MELWTEQTGSLSSGVTGLGAMAGGVPATAVAGGLQNASLAGIELGKKRMRDTNDDLLMVPRLLHDVHLPLCRTAASFYRFGH